MNRKEKLEKAVRKLRQAVDTYIFENDDLTDKCAEAIRRLNAKRQALGHFERETTSRYAEVMWQ